MSLQHLHILSTVRAPLCIARGLYIFYPLFEGQKRFFKEFFSENSAFMYCLYSEVVPNQEQVIMVRVRYIEVAQECVSSRAIHN